MKNGNSGGFGHHFHRLRHRRRHRDGRRLASQVVKSKNFKVQKNRTNSRRRIDDRKLRDDVVGILRILLAGQVNFQT